MSVMLSVLFGFALAGLPLFIYLMFFLRSGDIAATAYISIGVFLLLLGAELILIARPGKKIYEKLAA